MSDDNTNPRKHEMGQGAIEYILVGILILIVFAMLFFLVYGILTYKPTPCSNPTSFECLNHKVEQCLASEQYTKEQCVQLVGGDK